MQRRQYSSDMSFIWIKFTGPATGKYKIADVQLSNQNAARDDGKVIAINACVIHTYNIHDERKPSILLGLHHLSGSLKAVYSSGHSQLLMTRNVYERYWSKQVICVWIMELDEDRRSQTHRTAKKTLTALRICIQFSDKFDEQTVVRKTFCR